MIRVMLVDDYYILREGIRFVLSTVSDMEVVGAAGSGQEAIDMLKDVEPDIVIMDMHMPEMNGIKTTIQIKEMYPEMKIIFLTSFADEDMVITAVNVGANGFLYKKINGDVLIQSLRNVHADQNVFAGEAAKILARRIRDVQFNSKEILERKLKGRNITFTSREIEVACLLMENKTNLQIAKLIHLTEGTVKNYISEIYNKLDIHRRAGVISYLNELFEHQ